VNIAGTVYSALLFWHGAPTSVLRSNGAIQGAAESFASGDSVIVMKKINASMTSDCKVIYGGAKGKILLQKLVVYQDGHIARADNFPNDYLLYDNIFLILKIAIFHGVIASRNMLLCVRHGRNLSIRMGLSSKLIIFPGRKDISSIMPGYGIRKCGKFAQVQPLI